MNTKPRFHALCVSVALLIVPLGEAGIANAGVPDPFPSPWCEIDFPAEVEPITRVEFANIDHVSSAVPDGTPALENFTATQAVIVRGQSLEMRVQGNTNGRFEAVVTAYIDLNHDTQFSPGYERFDIGTLVASSGGDGQTVSATIVLPYGIPLGESRIRVTKKFRTAATPCNTDGYGQAEDYSLLVGPEIILKSGFDGGVVASGEINLVLPPNNPGIYLDWISGATCTTYDCGSNFNAYNNNAGLTFIWPSHDDKSEGGLTLTGNSFAILHSGETIGPFSYFVGYSTVGEPFNWRTGVDAYLGFIFDCSSLGVPPPGMCYGYAHLTTTSPTGYPATLVQYWYNSEGAPITIP